ncbi:MAG: caspase family protein [Candidatus Eremiobacterota bacterium]
MRNLIASLALSLTLTSAALADQALVVGVDRYPYLRSEAGLSGARNDANLMAERLRGLGFEVTVLTDDQATRKGILAALESQRQSLQKDERFVFYFSGHGTLADQPYLLPHDSEDDTLAADLSASELSKRVGALPAAHRTVLLDACFSETFLNAKGLGVERRARFYKKFRSKGLGPQGSNGYDVPQSFDGPVVFFVASRENEVAREDRFDSGTHGVFTYYLANALLKPRPLWSELQSNVSALVCERLQDTQHPTLTPGIGNQPVFGGPPAPGSAPATTTAWDIFHRDNVDRSRLELAMLPDRATVGVGEKLSFQVKVGAPGYLLLLEHGVSGKVQRLFPLSASVTEARVEAGQTVAIPGTDQAFAADRPGTERVRAFLLQSEEEARQLLDAFEGVKTADFHSFAQTMKSRDLALVRPKGVSTGGPVTADVFFQVEFR